jgi:hypothetical protein
MKSFKQYSEEAPTNSTGSAVDMNPNGKKKIKKAAADGRSRYSFKKIFKRANDK